MSEHNPFLDADGQSPAEPVSLESFFEQLLTDPSAAGNSPVEAAPGDSPVEESLSLLDKLGRETPEAPAAPPPVESLPLNPAELAHLESQMAAADRTAPPRVSIVIPNPKFFGAAETPGHGEAEVTAKSNHAESAPVPLQAAPEASLAEIPAPSEFEFTTEVSFEDAPAAAEVPVPASFDAFADGLPAENPAVPAEPEADLFFSELASAELPDPQDLETLAQPDTGAPAASTADGDPVVFESAFQETVAVPLEAAAPQAPAERLDQVLTSIDASLGESLAPSALKQEQAEPAAGEIHTCIVFHLNGTAYGIKIGSVLEMDTVPRITPLPNVPEFVSGVTNLRGEVLPVLNLRGMLGLPLRDQIDRGRILVVRTAKAEQTAVLLVDEVRGTTSVPFGGLDKPKEQLSDAILPLLHGVSSFQEQVLNVLDLERLFEVPAVRSLRN